MKSIIGIGNALTDILAVMEDDSILKKYRLPVGSMSWVDAETASTIWNEIKDRKIQTMPGGSAANTITGCAVLGLESAFIGKVGDDELGLKFKEGQERIGISSILLHGTQSSGRSMVFITPPNAERTFANFMGASLEQGPEDMKEDFFEGYDILHLEGYLVQNHDLVRRAVEIGKKLGMTISIDLASYNVVESNYDFLHEIVENYVDIVFANESESKSFTRKTPEDALDELARVCKIAVVKIGAQGSFVKSGNEKYRIAPFQAKAVDATGAGDMFAAGFLYGYSRGLPLDVCGKIGSLVSSKVVEIIGTKMDPSTWEEIKNNIAEIIDKA
ncbi:MAG: adenosine kinase [Bacteroidales bacterium]|nr:adenosine kinase [Bacteroidales bacterium]